MGRTMDIDFADLLMEVVTRRASDLHLSAGAHPTIRVFVGWGSEPYFSEYTSTGKLLFEGEWPGPNLSYRATLEPWVGEPLSPPLGAARTVDGKTTVYASWNGATRVTSWRVLAGASSGPLTRVASTSKSGFETAIPVSQSDKTFTVQALSAGGRVIGTSKQFGVGG